MPGRNDRGLAWASLMSLFALNRTVAAADTDLSFAETIDLTGSMSGLANTIVLAVKKTAGTGTVSVELYRNAPGSSLASDWRLVATQATIADGSEVRFTDLYAGIYKVKVTALTAGASWELHESHREF